MTVASMFPYLVAAFLFLAGLWGAATSKNLVHLVGCLTIIQSSTYVLLAAIATVDGGIAPVVDARHPSTANAVDPILQAVMLTDIVVEATVVAVLLALVIKAHEHTGTLDPDRIEVLRG